MSQINVIKESSKRAPRRGEIYERAHDMTARVYTTPSEWHGQFVEIENHTGASDLYIQFSSAAADFSSLPLAAAPSSVAGTGTAGDPYVLTADDQSSWEVPAGTITRILLPGGSAKLEAFAVISDGSSGSWSARVSSEV